MLLLLVGLVIAACHPSATVENTMPIANLQSYRSLALRVHSTAFAAQGQAMQLESAVLEFEMNPPPPRPVLTMLRSSTRSADLACAAATCWKLQRCCICWSTALSSCIAWPCAANAVE